MASVEKRRDDGRAGYLVRWRDEAGRQRKKTCPRKIDADRLRAEIEHKLNAGTYVDPAAGRRTFSTCAEAWRTAQPHRPNTATRVASQLRVHVYPVLGDRPIAAVRPSEIQALIGKLSTSLSPGSVRTVMATVRAIFGTAVRDRLIALDPCTRLALPAVQRQRVVPLTVAQVEALVEALPERYQALAVVGAGTGLRQGELFGLQVADVDFLRRLVRVECQVQPAPGGRVVVAPLKNRAAARTIPLGRVVVFALAEHLRKHPAGDDGYVFTGPNGSPLSRGSFNAATWTPARRRAGLPAGVGMHALRHFYASALITAGQSVKVVSARLGHSNAAMTLNCYAHLWPDDEDRTRAAIDDVFQGHVPRMCPARGV